MTPAREAAASFSHQATASQATLGDLHARRRSHPKACLVLGVAFEARHRTRLARRAMSPWIRNVTKLIPGKFGQD